MSTTTGNKTRLTRLAPARGMEAVEQHNIPEPRPWYLSTIGLALAGSALMWAAFPPLDLGMLGWVAPVCWLVLVRRAHLDGRHPYRNILLAGFGFWMAALWWLVLPHWVGAVGWIGLSAYLALYLALFIGLSRVAVHRYHVPTIVAAPIVWTGLELIRARLLTGFLMASLGHTQYKWTALIQISDLAGGYGVSFLVMLVAACVARMLPIERHRPAIWPLLPLVAAMAGTLCYGYWRLDSPPGPPAPKVALIQGNVPTVFGGEPQHNLIEKQYTSLSKQALAEHPEVELVVWPESMYWRPYYVVERGAWLPANMFTGHPWIPPDDAQKAERAKALPEWITAEEKAYRNMLQATVAKVRSAGQTADSAGGSPAANVPSKALFMFGMDTIQYLPGKLRRYSSSVFVNNAGEVAGCYNKMHPVVFGEYVPLGDYIPALYALTPLSGGLTAGEGPEVFHVGKARVAPNICYETVMPHLIRDQVAALGAAGKEPDVLVTQTNDGWYRGTSALDMHMVCSVFRAVECRKPMFLAANTGISAVIDGNGVIRGRLAPGEESFLIVNGESRGPGDGKHLVPNVRLDGRVSPYVRFGDTLGIASAGACLLLLAVGLTDRFRRPSPRATA